VTLRWWGVVGVAMFVTDSACATVESLELAIGNYYTSSGGSYDQLKSFSGPGQSFFSTCSRESLENSKFPRKFTGGITELPKPPSWFLGSRFAAREGKKGKRKERRKREEGSVPPLLFTI